MTTDHNNIERGSFIVYIAGVEVPVLEVTVSSGVWQFPEAVISMVPDVELVRLGREDRVPAAVFYLDTHYSEDGTKAEEPEFRLLFDGEITGWEYRNTPMGRTMAFRAVAHAQVWTQWFQHFMTTVEDYATSYNYEGWTSGITTADVVFPFSLFKRNLIDGELIKKPYDFIENLFRFICTPNATTTTALSVNFFAPWALRTSFKERWAPCPYVEVEDVQGNFGGEGIFPILRAVQDTKVLKGILKHVSDLGGKSSVWEYISNIFQILHYELILNPAPACVKYDLAKDTMGGIPAVKETKSGSPRTITSGTISRVVPANSMSLTFTEGRDKVRLLNYVTSPNLQFCIPPMCNVIFPSMVTGYGMSENYLAQPTRILMNPSAMEAHNIITDRASIESVMANTALTTAYPEIARRSVELADSHPTRQVHGFIVYPEEYFKGPVPVIKHPPPHFTQMAKAYLQDIRGPGGPAPEFLYSNLVDETLGKFQLGQLYDAYTKFEYHRARAANKRGTIDTLFNPYVVAGYPGVVFDLDDTGVHTTSTFVQVTHRLSAHEMKTSINYVNARTFGDFFEALAEDRKLVDKATNTVPNEFGLTEAENKALRKLREHRDYLHARGTPLNPAEEASVEKIEQLARLYTRAQMGGQIDQINAAPLTTVLDVRYRFQHGKRADEAYKRLFHRDEIGKAAAFDWTEYISVQGGKKIKNDETLEVTTRDGNSLSEKAFAYPGVKEDQHFVINPNMAKYAKDSRKALQHTSRPVCTLKEYVAFMGYNAQVKVVSSSGEGGKGASYYEEILDTWEPLTDQTQGNLDPDTLQPREVTLKDVEMRYNWHARLKKYREKVYKRSHPHSA
jgi:hypothetical protein